MNREEKDEILAENDFAERFWNMFLHAILSFTIIIMIAIIFFRGDPDLVDSLITFLNHGTKCL